ncbi:malto-oligosyltrehalose trehalohydrolase [Corynebacterium mendelii]|uniref:Malto-oligosyltrehalose trehalohydrolase n=1 Tax=Corynebacterium mendelii TaxID=2765362 RepID=A0A939DZ07_9CORY|nr:malto-oligosyltrehalose trehalohydrolase [Corynebacterium mendelii]MBN9643633.1 malto-oligosyltrehalose trehalohydrolase [Corynebacterium mendelii]
MTNPAPRRTPTTYRVWAPTPADVRLVVDGTTHPMTPADNGWWESFVPLRPGARYGYRLFDGDTWSKVVPDPRARRLPDGVHGLAETTDETSFTFTDDTWRGVSPGGQVIYELHTGTFTEQGDFAGIETKLDYLADLGVTVIELMPVQPFGGNRNWGYDGVSWHAVHEGYGGPEGLKHLVDAAHAKGIAVMLDVVYNHFGPDGNYAGMFGPYTTSGDTAWGDVVNLWEKNSDEVRNYILDAVYMWLTDYHIDGLRLDAVQAYHDPGAEHILAQMQKTAEQAAAETGRQKFLIAESDQNDPRLTRGRAGGGYGLAAQWDDDIHHALHTLVSGEQHAYYSDFGTTEVLAKTLTGVFYHNGCSSSFRGRTHGAPVDTHATPASCFVTYTTTHDQTGNRARGDRPSMNLPPEKQVLKAAVICCSPYTPMLFMGEEFGAETPFAFFCSHTDDELNRLTDQGRHREFAYFGWDTDDVPVPSDEQTFLDSKLRWDFSPEQQRILDAYTTLLRLRRTWRLARPWLDEVTVNHSDQWLTIERDDVFLAANFSDREQRIPLGGRLIYSFTGARATDSETILDPWGFALVART